MWVKLMSNDFSIRVRRLGNRYTLSRPQENYLTLRDAIVNFAKVTFVYFSDIEHAMKPGFLRLGDINAR